MAEKSFHKQNTLPDLSVGEPSTAPFPSRIGPYKIESLLSRGGMSLLYLGIHPDTKQTLAIKVLSPDYLTHPEAVDRFLKEARIIGITNHPNIVKLYGQGEWEGGLYIAMEFIRGISLSQFIVQHSLSLKRCIDILLQVAYALLHLHTHGVIHRDLKPENILITEDGEIKVIDFGIAQLHEEIQEKPSLQTQVLGTPSYMSPEQKEDSTKVTFASDIYSLAVIGYELVLGKLSFGVINLSILPKGLKKIIEKALAVSLKERYQDIVDLITDLSDYLKSGELERERPGSDQAKEVLESLGRAASGLSPPSLPEWPELEIGLAKHKGPAQMGVYYDFFKFPNGSFGIVLAESLSPDIDAAIYIAGLRGVVRTLIQEKAPSGKNVFPVIPFFSTLQEMIAEDGIRQSFALGFVLLDPLREQLAFVSCGLGRLIHLEQASIKPRLLTSENLPLGSRRSREFVETVDNWNMGDTLILHSFETAFSKEEALQKELEIALLNAISDSTLFSAERQAEAILKKMANLPIFAQQRLPKIILTLRRIS